MSEAKSGDIKHEDVPAKPDTAKYVEGEVGDSHIVLPPDDATRPPDGGQGRDLPAVPSVKTVANQQTDADGKRSQKSA